MHESRDIFYTLFSFPAWPWDFLSTRNINRSVSLSFIVQTLVYPHFEDNQLEPMIFIITGCQGDTLPLSYVHSYPFSTSIERLRWRIIRLRNSCGDYTPNRISQHGQGEHLKGCFTKGDYTPTGAITDCNVMLQSMEFCFILLMRAGHMRM